MRWQFAIAMVLLAAFPTAAENRDVAGMETKLARLERNASANPVDSSPTEFSEREINAYFAAGRVQLPDGVQSVTFEGQPGVITATTHVDLDRIKAGRTSMNPLLTVLSGVHDIVVVAHAEGGGHEGVVHVDSVDLDGVDIPRFVLQAFVEKYLQSKYPGVGLDSRFPLPAKVDTATVGQGKLTVTQK